MTKITLLIIILITTTICFKQTRDKHLDFINVDNLKTFDLQPARKGEWPFFMVVTMGPAVVCGGSLIRDKWVLTGGACVFRDPANNEGNTLSGAVPGVEKLHTARELDFSSWSNATSSSGQKSLKYSSGYDVLIIKNVGDIIRSKRDIIHELYDPHLFIHDIALMLLSKPVKLSDKVRLIKIPSTKPQFNDKCLTAGFGLYKPRDHDKPPEYRDRLVLHEMHLVIAKNQLCHDVVADLLQKVYKILNPEDNATSLVVHDKICAKSIIDKATVQETDNGGPFVCDGHLFGIVNPIVHIAYNKLKKNPEVNMFTDVFQYVTWINQILQMYHAEDLAIDESSLPSSYIHTSNITFINKLLCLFITVISFMY